MQSHAARALSSDPLSILLIHDEWANRAMLTACQRLSREQFHQPFDIGLGSLHAVTTHIVSVIGRWSDRLMGREPRPMLIATPGFTAPTDARDRTPDELLDLLRVVNGDLRAAADDGARKGLETTISLVWPSKDGPAKRYTFTRGAVLVHVCTHGMYHRAQCANMLRRIGAPGVSDAIPDLAVVDWQSATEAPPEYV